MNESYTKLNALRDLALVMLVLVSVKQTVLPFSMLYAGPASTLCAMLLGTFLLYRQGASWAALGLRFGASKTWLRFLGLTALTVIVIIATGAITSNLAGMFFMDLGGSGRFDFVEGNLVAYLAMFIFIWTHGSFFEELLFRAFIITKASEVLGGSFRADIAAAVFSAVFFGYRHFYYQGMQGALVTGAIGLALALLYLKFGRKNLLPLIIAHGIVNSLAHTSRFLGPGD